MFGESRSLIQSNILMVWPGMSMMIPWSTWVALLTWSQTPSVQRTSRLPGASTGGGTARSMTGKRIPSLKSLAEERCPRLRPRQQQRRRPQAPQRGQALSLSRAPGAVAVTGVRWGVNVNASCAQCPHNADVSGDHGGGGRDLLLRLSVRLGRGLGLGRGWCHPVQLQPLMGQKHREKILWENTLIVISPLHFQ